MDTEPMDVDPSTMLGAALTIENDVKRHIYFEDSSIIKWSTKLPIPSHHLFNPAKEPPHVSTSPEITLGNPWLFTQTKWRIQFSPDHFHRNRERTVAIYLWRLDNLFDHGPKEVSVLYKIHILDKKENPVFTRESGIRKFKKGACYGWKDFAPYNKVRPYMENDRVRVRLEMMMLWKHPFVDVDAMDVNLTVIVGDVDLTVNKATVMQKSWPMRQLLLKLESDTDTLILSSKLVSNLEITLIQLAFEFMEKGYCFYELVPLLELWKTAEEMKMESMKIYVFNEMMDEQNLRVSHVLEYVLFIRDNLSLVFQPPYAKAYNKFRNFLLRNLEIVKQSSLLRHAVLGVGNKPLVEGLVMILYRDYATVPTHPCVYPISYPISDNFVT